MPRPRPASILLGLVLCALAVGGADRALAESARLYTLAPGSELQQGCFPPCLCPAIVADLRGTFWLTPRGSDPLFDLYEVSRVNWRVTLGGADVPITGAGTYRRGGEFALMHQLELNLTIGDGDAPEQHFDSGLVVGGSEFPAIDIHITLNGEVCYDTVIRVLATPTLGCG